MERNALALLEQRWQAGKFVCVGLDTDYQKIPLGLRQSHRWPSSAMTNFNQAVVTATMDDAAAFKLNLGFYLAESFAGLTALIATAHFIHDRSPDAIVILDGKLGDIGNTSEAYAKFAFDVVGADAVTLNPYLGSDGLEPFLKRADKLSFILCRTSNPGASEFQDLRIGPVCPHPLYRIVAENVRERWNANRNCGLVIGATRPTELKELRTDCPDLPLLIPAVGRQGGDLIQVTQHAPNSRGTGFIVNASRSIIYASSDNDFDEAAAAEAKRMNAVIVEALAQRVPPNPS